MKRFVWRLQRVLDVKTKQEQVKRIELFRLTEELAGKRSELLMRRRILQDVISDVARTQSPTRMSAQEFCLRHAATNDEQIRRLRQEIAELEARQREKTAELLTIKRFKEGLERLRAEAHERFVRECDRLEQKDSDDKTTSAFARKQCAEDRCEM
jgi:flagellar export protein FliJ